MELIYLKNFYDIYNSKHNFHGIIRELNNSYYNCTDGTQNALRYGMIKYNKKEETFIIIDRNRTMIYDSTVGFLDLKALSLKDKLESDEKDKLIAYIKPLMINATDKAVNNKDYYIFYFNQLLTLNNIKIQNDVLTKETVKADGIKTLSAIGGFISSAFIYNYIKLNAAARTAAQVTAHASHMLTRTGSLFNYAWGENGLPTMLRHGTSFILRHELPPSYQEYEQDRASSLYSNSNQQEEYIDEDTEALNKKARYDLNDLYKNNQKFRDEIINFIGDETELGNEKILDKRYIHNNLNKLGMETLAKFAFSKDHARSLIEIIASYK